MWRHLTCCQLNVAHDRATTQYDLQWFYCYYAEWCAVVLQRQYFSILLSAGERGHVLMCQGQQHSNCELLVYGNSLHGLPVGIYQFVLSTATAACPMERRWYPNPHSLIGYRSCCLGHVVYTKFCYFVVSIWLNKSQFITLSYEFQNIL